VGKWAENPNKTQTTLVNSVKELYELLTSPSIEVTNYIFPNDNVVWVSWKHSEDNIAAGKNVNVAVAAYLTTQSRLKLYEYLSKLESLSCTDIVILIQNVDEHRKVRTGGYFGDVTDHLEEFGSISFIHEFLSGGQKNYAFLFSALRHENVRLNAR